MSAARCDSLSSIQLTFFFRLMLEVFGTWSKCYSVGNWTFQLSSKRLISYEKLFNVKQFKTSISHLLLHRHFSHLML